MAALTISLHCRHQIKGAVTMGHASNHVGTTKVADDLGQMESGDIGSVAYALGTNSRRTLADIADCHVGDLRPRLHWSGQGLSSAETSMAQLMPLSDEVQSES
jgi:hypothetical protein